MLVRENGRAGIRIENIKSPEGLHRTPPGRAARQGGGGSRRAIVQPWVQYPPHLLPPSEALPPVLGRNWPRSVAVCPERSNFLDLPRLDGDEGAKK